MKTKFFKNINLPLLRRGLGGGLLLLTAIAYCLLFAVGCEKNDDNNDPPSGPGSITLTSCYEYEYEIKFAATAQQLVIDWGDGSAAETYTDVTAPYNGGHYYSNITHTYPDRSTYTIQIKEEGLTVFDCQISSVTSLNVSGCAALQKLYCNSTPLTSLDVSKCPALQRLHCHYTPLTSLNVSGCAALQELVCEGARLTSLDVSKYPALQKLYCDGNQLTSLDVSKCPALQMLYCAANQLTSLDVSKCPALQELSCNSNQLTSLDVSGCPALQKLYCDWNQLTASALNTVFTALPNRTGEVSSGVISIVSNPGTNSCNRAIAENKGWSVM
jgi:Leucine-rich repeat (LRR) protein